MDCNGKDSFERARRLSNKVFSGTAAVKNQVQGRRMFEPDDVEVDEETNLQNTLMKVTKLNLSENLESEDVDITDVRVELDEEVNQTSAATNVAIANQVRENLDDNPDPEVSSSLGTYSSSSSLLQINPVPREDLNLDQPSTSNWNPAPVKPKRQTKSIPKNGKGRGASSKGRGSTGKKRGRPKLVVDEASSSKKIKSDQFGQVAEEEYLVEKIVDKKIEPTGVKYLIKWIGWPSSSNTWEPPTHLSGCEDVLKEFEARWEQQHSFGAQDEGPWEPFGKNKRKISATPAAAGGATSTSMVGTPNVNPNAEEASDSEYDSEENESRRKNSEFLEFDVMEHWPLDKQPVEVIGVVSIHGTLTYLVEWKTEQENMVPVGAEVPKKNHALVKALPFQLMYPSLIISFYEKQIRFIRNPTTEQVLAERAASSLAAAKKEEIEKMEVEENDGAEMSKKRKSMAEIFKDLDDSSSADEYVEDTDLI